MTRDLETYIRGGGARRPDLTTGAAGQGVNPRRDLRAPGRGVRGERVQADHLHDHRPGDRGHERVAEPAAGPGLPGGVHRRDPRQDGCPTSRDSVLGGWGYARARQIEGLSDPLRP